MLTVALQNDDIVVSEDMRAVDVCVTTVGENVAEFSVPVTLSLTSINATGNQLLLQSLTKLSP